MKEDRKVFYYISIERLGIESSTQANAEQVCRDIKRFLKAFNHEDAIVTLKSWDDYWREQDIKNI